MLTNSLFNGILPLGDNILQFRNEKHPASKIADDEVLMSRENLRLDPVIMRVLMKT